MAKRCETKAFSPLIKNGKYFIPPPGGDSDFKGLFQQLTSAGAGRPVDKDGFPVGQWTPELLAQAISTIESNRAGVDLRTVQLWFQENEKGISADNIRWLARIFGCGDPDASAAWQVELSAANKRLAAKRTSRKARAQFRQPPAAAAKDNEAGDTRAPATVVLVQKSGQRSYLANKTEALFGSQSSMALPLVVFTGACTLGLISFTLNVHSVVLVPENAPPKQVGFLWAPNWTIVFLAVLPLYLALVIDLLQCWKEEWRPRLAALGNPALPVIGWEPRLAAASYSFWATLFVTMIIASGYNWTATHLIPLLNGDPGGWALDWGRIAIVRPDLLSVPSAIAFTGFVFLFNGFTAYLFFSGLIFLHLMKHDYLELVKALESRCGKKAFPEIEDVGFSLMLGVFRCTSLGVVITILMKLQSGFLQSNSIDMIDWLVADFRSLFGNHASGARVSVSSGIVPGFYYSFFCLLAIFGTFLNASMRMRRVLARIYLPASRCRFIRPWLVMNGSMSLLVTGYFLIGVLPGFTVFLLFSLVLAGYLLSKSASVWNQVSQ